MKVEITSNYGMCPNQIHGTIDGREFYFRARHGSWQLYWEEDMRTDGGSPFLEGDSENAGWWERETAEGFCLGVLSSAGVPA